MLKHVLEIEIVIKSLLSNTRAHKYGLQNYIDINNLDENAKEKTKNKIINKI